MAFWSRLFAISVGGILGVNARYWLGLWINRSVSSQFPWATVTINVSGSFVIGLLSVILARWFPHPNFRLFAVVGFLGGYTTFSTFMFESATLLERGEFALLLSNVFGSVIAGTGAVLLGLLVGGAICANPQGQGTPVGSNPSSAAGAEGGVLIQLDRGRR